MDAAADINVVRARANAQPISPSEVNIGTILDERDRELFYEELRHEELARISYLFAQTGKSDYKGRTYNMENFSNNNFWCNRILDKTEFYNKGIHTKHVDEYKISPFNVLFPIPQSAIDANSLKQINQNEGYTGVENNVAPLEILPTD